MKKLLVFVLVVLVMVVAADALSAPRASITMSGTTDFVELSVTKDGLPVNGELATMRPRILLVSANRLEKLSVAPPAGLLEGGTPPPLTGGVVFLPLVGG